MGRLTIVDRLHIITLLSHGHSVTSIHKRLLEENVLISLRGIYYLVEKFREKGTIVDLPHQRRRWKLTQEMRRFIEEEMSKDELTSRRMKTLLREKWPDMHVSIPTIKRSRKDIGLIVGIGQKSYGFLKFRALKINLAIGFIRKNPAGMHWLGYNDAVSCLNEAKTQIFQPTANFEIFKIYLYRIA